MDLTDSQKDALEHGLGNCCVSASAGSGKTFVLTQRVIRLINEGTKLNEFLILTFTNLAAAEMRDRIRDELNKVDTEYNRQIVASLDSASIQTYDAFALNLVKKYHDRLGLPKDVSLIDEVLLQIQKHKLLDDIMSSFYAKNDPDVLSLVEDYCYKNDSDLKTYIIALSQKFDLKENKKEFIENYESLYLNEKFINKVIDQYVSNITTKFENYISKMKTFDNPDYYDVNIEVVDKLAKAKDYDTLHSLLVDQDLKLSLKGCSLKDFPDNQESHSKMTKYRNEIRKELCYSSQKEIVEQYIGTKKNVKTLLKIISILDEEMTKYKRKFSVYSFSDIFKFALQLTMIPDVKEELRNRFKYIMIDEYQDTSDLQEKFIDQIANNNVYVVGDVKQSIYRFRNANCDLFANKMKNYGSNNGGTLHILPENFRSRKQIIKTVNYIFEGLMDEKNCGLNYAKDHAMIHGNKSYIEKNDDYNTEIIEYSSEEQNDSDFFKDEYEARLIATDILNKINSGYEVYNKDEQKLRKCEFSDFAILMRKKGKFNIYQKVFNEYQIPLFANYEKSIRENDFTLAFENIVKLIVKNKNKDFSHGYKHSYVSVMRSFLMNATNDEVQHIATVDNSYKDFPLFNKIETIIDKNKDGNLKGYILTIAEEFDVFNRAITIGNVGDVHSLVEYYFNVASQMDKMGYTIEDFVNYFNDLKKFDIDPAFSPNGNIKNCVNLLSIHSSKGLQYKICYYPALRSEFTFKDKSMKGKFNYSNTYGISVPNVHHRVIDNIVDKVIAENEKKDVIREEIRLFYVALTRAEEKIIFVANTDEKKVDDLFSCNSFYALLKLNNLTFPTRKVEIKDLKGTLETSDSTLKIDIKKTPIMNGGEVIITHASKQLDDDVDANLLLLGTKYHYYLEITDFKTKDVSFIKDESDRKLLTKFLSQNVFKNSAQAKVLHEYKFFDEINNVSGSIDLLLIYSDHIDIIDFKLSRIEDEAYERQLEKYKNYISQISNLPIHTYVTGILSGQVKMID